MSKSTHKHFTISLSLPVTLEVLGNNASGEVEITSILNIQLPSLSTLQDSLTTEALTDIDKAFAEA